MKDELATLSRQGDDFRRIIQPVKEDLLWSLARFLNSFDIRTAYPLLLTFLDERVGITEWKTISVTIESYLLRRAVCGLTTKSYNRVFLALTRNIRRDGATPENLAKLLAAQSGESVEWPSDDTFEEAWRNEHAYHNLNNAKVVYILKRLNDTYLGNKMELLEIDGPMTVEHILPQNWFENWSLPDGTKGMTFKEILDTVSDDPRAVATGQRKAALQTFGNLTILTQPLNSAASNSSWAKKKPELLRHSLLPINQQLHGVTLWDETSIEKRATDLFQRALEIWPRLKRS